MKDFREFADLRLSELSGLTLIDDAPENGRLQVRAATSKSRHTRTIAPREDARREVGRYRRDLRATFDSQEAEMGRLRAAGRGRAQATRPRRAG